MWDGIDSKYAVVNVALDIKQREIQELKEDIDDEIDIVMLRLRDLREEVENKVYVESGIK